MRYTHLKNSDVDVSQLAVGTWAIGGDSFGENDDAASMSAIRTMLDHGVNLIDTAPCYGNGTSEKVVGNALRGIDRESYLLSTKVGLITSAAGYDRDSSFKNIMREVESSLRNLRTDYIDFYFVHWPDAKTPFSETMCALQLLKEQGKIRHIGVSNFTPEMIEECEKVAQVDVQQPPYSMVDRSSEDLIKWGYERGIDSFTYGSLGAGILSGKFRELPKFEEGDVRAGFHEYPAMPAPVFHFDMYRITDDDELYSTGFYDYFQEPKFSRVQELLKVMDEIAEAHDKPVAQVAVNWSTQKEYVDTALVGVRTDAHAIQNCETFEWELSADEMAKLDAKLDELKIG